MKTKQGKWKQVDFVGRSKKKYSAKLLVDGSLYLSCEERFAPSISFPPEDLQQIVRALAECAWEVGVA